MLNLSFFSAQACHSTRTPQKHHYEALSLHPTKICLTEPSILLINENFLVFDGFLIKDMSQYNLQLLKNLKYYFIIFIFFVSILEKTIIGLLKW